MRCCLYILAVSALISALPLWAAQGSCSPQAPRSPYRLQAGDSFEVVYRMTPEYDQTVSVQPNGTVTLQLFGSIKIGGLTLDGARRQIMQVAATRLRDPELWLELKDYERPQFTVLGEINKPGRYELRGPLTVQEGLALAGGFKISARHTNILLINRIDDETGETHLINFKALEKPKPGMSLCLLNPGDMIIVPTSKLSKVERYVKVVNTGVYYNPTPP